VSLIKTLAEQEKVRIVPREPADKFESFSRSQLDERITAELVNRLGPGTVVASSVNGEQGLWVGFTIEGDSYWLLMDPSRLRPLWGAAWMIWLLAAGALSLMGAAIIAGLINAPLKQLSLATSRVREGDFDAPPLDERTVTKEIREVNIGFNRMAEQLAKIELDRTEMLAGISHDLRTPLARLRLETELSVLDPDARELMVADIAQLDVIIDKFLDYARPDHVSLSPTSVAEVIESCVFPFRSTAGMDIRVEVPHTLQAMADEVELGRVISNLLENARRYGKSPSTGLTRVNITAQTTSHHVHIRVRDFGPGVSPDQLEALTKPFVRGDAARTEAKGAGLGLAIVDKTVARMGGTFSLSNAQPSGLAALITLPLP
jgi:two-component system osmolarity sensor histidine kinase EnvZ